MIRKSILLVLLIAASVLAENDRKEEADKELKNDVITENYCSMNELEGLDYYLFCDSQLHEGAGGFTFKPCIIGGETETIEEAKQLYQEFIERLPLDFEEKNEDGDITYVSYVSPDCKCVLTNKWSEYETMRTQILFYEKKKVREKVNEIRVEDQPILIVKDEDSYGEMDEGHYKMLSKLKEESYDEGDLPVWRINAEGNLLAAVRDSFDLLTIREIKGGTEQWSFPLQGIQEEVARIRDDIKEGDTELVLVQQFEGNEKEGWLTVQAGRSSFFQIAYPSGEETYLGEYMYSACFSPDGKYVAYSSVDYDNGGDMKPEEYERMERICPPGICVREIETGKTAYIYWDPARNPEEDYLEYRHFMWIEKESFNEFMKKDALEEILAVLQKESIHSSYGREEEVQDNENRRTYTVKDLEEVYFYQDENGVIYFIPTSMANKKIEVGNKEFYVHTVNFDKKVHYHFYGCEFYKAVWKRVIYPEPYDKAVTIWSEYLEEIPENWHLLGTVKVPLPANIPDFDENYDSKLFENEYTDAITELLHSVLHDREEYGEYLIYIGDYQVNWSSTYSKLGYNIRITATVVPVEGKVEEGSWWLFFAKDILDEEGKVVIETAGMGLHERNFSPPIPNIAVQGTLMDETVETERLVIPLTIREEDKVKELGLNTDEDGLNVFHYYLK